MDRQPSRLGSAMGCAALAVAVAGCSKGGPSRGAGAGDSGASTVDVDAEPSPCGDFTEAGAPCPVVSPVRCFACGDAGGGCYCRATSEGPHWRCTVDPSCLPCAPGDENCAPSIDDAG